MTKSGQISRNKLTPPWRGKYMSQAQYLKMLEKEIQKINSKIDLKILQGEKYAKEARDHKLLLRKVRYHTRKGLMNRLVNLFFRTPLIHA